VKYKKGDSHDLYSRYCSNRIIFNWLLAVEAATNITTLTVIMVLAFSFWLILAPLVLIQPSLHPSSDWLSSTSSTVEASANQ
jgi:hypothetical protein